MVDGENDEDSPHKRTQRQLESDVTDDRKGDEADEDEDGDEDDPIAFTALQTL